VTHTFRACESSVSGAGRKSGGACVAENDRAGEERGAGGHRAGTERGAGWIVPVYSRWRKRWSF